MFSRRVLVSLFALGGLGGCSAASSASSTTSAQAFTEQNAVIVRSHRTAAAAEITRGFDDAAELYASQTDLVKTDFCFEGKAEDACTTLKAQAAEVSGKVENFTCAVALPSRVDITYGFPGSTLHASRRVLSCDGSATSVKFYKATLFADTQVPVRGWPNFFDPDDEKGQAMCYVGDPSGACASAAKAVQDWNDDEDKDPEGYEQYEK
jgi:hypothetical protein